MWVNLRLLQNYHKFYRKESKSGQFLEDNCKRGIRKEEIPAFPEKSYWESPVDAGK